MVGLDLFITAASARLEIIFLDLARPDTDQSIGFCPSLFYTPCVASSNQQLINREIHPRSNATECTPRVYREVKKVIIELQK